MNHEYLLRMVERPDLRPYLDDEQFEFRRSVARVLHKHATPDYVRDCDENKRFPAALIATAVDQGWFALTIPEEYGGIGGYLDMAAFLEIAAYHSIGLTRFWNVNVNMVGGAIARFADERIKSLLLPQMLQGQTWFAFALSENGSGSDAASLTTRAVEDGDHLVVDGTKMWITGAAQAKSRQT